jgi:anti-sigma regulatory factor (Ser/Thr protein kinase)
VELVLAANEIASNSIEHGGGSGVLRLWGEHDRVVCEVRDGGRLDDPLADRRLPAHDGPRGRGLWIANHVCDLVQVRSTPEGTLVRLHMRR